MHYNHKLFQFEYGSDLPSGLRYACVIRINGTHVAMTGGHRGSTLLSDFLLLNLDTGVWETMPSMPASRFAHMCGYYNGEIFFQETFNNLSYSKAN